MIITGTRPQIIKITPVFHMAERKGLKIFSVFTGQHYDYGLTDAIFADLAIPPPDTHLRVGSGSNAYHISQMVRELVPVIQKAAPDAIIVPGDTNSALASALAAFKMEVPVCHLEAGLRSHDLRMQEELNRRLIDHGSSTLFAPTELALSNLKSEKVLGSIIHSGDTMCDLLLNSRDKIAEAYSNLAFAEESGINEDFAVLTLHRKENVDSKRRLKTILSSLDDAGFPILFPVHPRTASRMKDAGLMEWTNIRCFDPLPYSAFLSLVTKAALILTDSGGLQKEAFLLETPCVTLRDVTEWKETVHNGGNVLVGANPQLIHTAIDEMFGKQIHADYSLYGNGRASARIVEYLMTNVPEVPTVESL